MFVAEGGCGSLPCRSPQERHRHRLLGGGGFGSRTGCLSPCRGPFTQSPCSFVPIAEEVMTQQVDVLTPSVRKAQEWLRKTELHLKQEGKESFLPGYCSGSLVAGSADSRVNLKWGCL